jgi:3-mercaptopyruvate sulfurtransferase SseA
MILYFTSAYIIALALYSSASLIYAQDKQVTSDPWPDNQVLKPEKLEKMLSNSTEVKPLIMQVGVSFQYKNAHIPGAKYTGMAATPEGIESLKKEVQKLSRDKEIILYCGCCPWKDCPNIRPAFKTLQQMGFKNVNALYISKNFQTDWIDKKFPVEKK